MKRLLTLVSILLISVASYAAPLNTSQTDEVSDQIAVIDVQAILDVSTFDLYIQTPDYPVAHQNDVYGYKQEVSVKNNINTNVIIVDDVGWRNLERNYTLEAAIPVSIQLNRMVQHIEVNKYSNYTANRMYNVKYKYNTFLLS